MMKKRSNTASIVVVLSTFALLESIVRSQDTCNFVKWIMCEKGMAQAAEYSLPKYVRVENFLCDTQSDGGGWIIFQRRFKGDTEFNRTWKEYKKGFGSKCNDYWLGNDYLHIATKWGKYELRIDMVYRDRSYYAKYSDFKVGNESNKYRLTAKKFTGNVFWNDLGYHSGYPFSTIDVDNAPQKNECFNNFTSGWWYHGCNRPNANLNGEFNNPDYTRGFQWPSFTFGDKSLSTVEMKLRIKK